MSELAVAAAEAVRHSVVSLVNRHVSEVEASLGRRERAEVTRERPGGGGATSALFDRRLLMLLGISRLRRRRRRRGNSRCPGGSRHSRSGEVVAVVVQVRLNVVGAERASRADVN